MYKIFIELPEFICLQKKKKMNITQEMRKLPKNMK